MGDTAAHRAERGERLSAVEVASLPGLFDEFGWFVCEFPGRERDVFRSWHVRDAGSGVCAGCAALAEVALDAGEIGPVFFTSVTGCWPVGGDR